MFDITSHDENEGDDFDLGDPADQWTRCFGGLARFDQRDGRALSPISLRMINGIRAKQANGQGDRRMNEKKAMRGEPMELIDKQGRIQAVLSAEYGMPYIVRYDGKGRILS